MGGGWGRLFAVLGVLVLAGGVRGETFDLAYFPYCAAGSNCGHPSRDALAQYVCEAAQVVNEAWRPTGISFRPALRANDPDAPADKTGMPAAIQRYREADGCADGDDEKATRRHWRNNVAASFPDQISVRITPPQQRCCSPIARTNVPAGALHGLFCDLAPSRTAFQQGKLHAHELGHHWGLSHTHGGCPDAADDENVARDADNRAPKTCSESDANGDSVDCGNDEECADRDLGTCEPDHLPLVNDTPPDRCGFEQCKLVCEGETTQRCAVDGDCAGDTGPCVCSESGVDEDASKNSLDGHGWIASPQSNRALVPIADDISAGSPQPVWCDAEIKEQADGVITASDRGPMRTVVRDVMSYHGSDCTGPYILNGVRFEAFTPRQLERVAGARSEVAPRAALPDVCAARGGDGDHDGICQDDDNCPARANTCQQDADGDDLGDPCDLCPNDATPTDDIDLDGIGDACDPDMDNDGCLNAADDNPEQAFLLASYYPGNDCPKGIAFRFAFEGDDIDEDGTPSCADPDDDGDGLLDADDPCPEKVGSECEDSRPAACSQSWWMDCMYGDCAAHLVKLEFPLPLPPDPNPFDPPCPEVMVFDRVEMMEGAIFARTPAGFEGAPAEAMAFLEGCVGPLPDMSLVTVSVWERSASGQETFRDNAGYFTRSQFTFGERNRGGFIRIEPSATGDALSFATTDLVGKLPGEGPDADGDGIPQPMDNCLGTGNSAQTDADGDGVGNACDADIDNDGRVDTADVRRVRGCLGTDLSVEMPILEEPMQTEEGVPERLPAEPAALAAARAAGCQGMDLDEDGQVKDNDVALAEAMVGSIAGASAMTRGTPQARPFVSVCVGEAPLTGAQIRTEQAGRGKRRMQRFRLAGQLDWTNAEGGSVDALANGARAVVRDASGATLLDAWIPAGAHTRSGGGWSRISGSRWRGRSADGNTKIVVAIGDGKRGRTARMQVAARGSARAGTVASVPLFLQVNFAPDAAATDLCAASDFGTTGRSACRVAKHGAKVRCG